MSFEVLYYPNYEPPIKWFRSFLLFYDSIRTVVPSDAEYVPSQEISIILDKIPSAITRVAPSKNDILIDNMNLEVLHNAFKIIAEKRNTKGIVQHETSPKLVMDRYGRFSGGYTSLHESKISYKVHNLLKKFQLIEPEITKLVKGIDSTFQNYSIVDQNASNLILSNISAKIATRYGLPSITDTELDFAVNAISSFDYRVSTLKAKACLAKAIISLEIPKEISDLFVKQYIDIRNAYAEVREPFQSLITNLCTTHNLSDISDMKILREKTQCLANNVNIQVSKIRNSQVGRNIRGWTPIYIGGLIDIVGEVVGFSPEIKIAARMATTTIQLMHKYIEKPELECDRTYRLIGGDRKSVV